MITWQSTSEAVLLELGERLKALRIAAGYSQQKLAAACDVSVPVIARMEKGDGGVKFVTWVDALRILGELEKFSLLMPDSQMTPYDFAEAARPKRQRAARSDRKVPKKQWKWGE